MGLEQLTATILDEVKKEAASTLSAAESERRRMLSDAKAAGEAGRKGAEARTEEFVEAQRRERIAWARIEAKRGINEARESVVDGAIEEVFEKLRAFPKDKAYPKFLNALVEKGLKELDAPKAVVHVRKDDKKHLKNGKYSVKDDLDEWGGCIVESEDGSVRIGLTFTALMEQKRELLRKRLYESLFKPLSPGRSGKGKDEGSEV